MHYIFSSKFKAFLKFSYADKISVNNCEKVAVFNSSDAKFFFNI